jgi:hypothetical protein
MRLLGRLLDVADGTRMPLFWIDLQRGAAFRCVEPRLMRIK